MKKYQILIFVPLLLVIGCSGEDGSATNDKPSSEHVFKDKVQALEKAKELEIMLQNAADKQRQTIEEQTKDMR